MLYYVMASRDPNMTDPLARKSSPNLHQSQEQPLAKVGSVYPVGTPLLYVGHSVNVYHHENFVYWAQRTGFSQ